MQTTPKLDPFAHCVLGPVGMPSSGLGAPTGHTEPTIVLDHRQTVTIAPNSDGAIAFAVVGGAGGCVAVGQGTFTLSSNEVALDNLATDRKKAEGMKSASITLGFQGPNRDQTVWSNYPVIPYQETIVPFGTATPDFFVSTGLHLSKFRTLTSTANVTFTGSSMYNNGTATTGRVSHAFDEDTEFPGYHFPTPVSGAYPSTASPQYDHQTGARLVQAPPTSFTTVAGLPGARVFPARESVQITNVPSCFEFQPVRQDWCPFTVYGAASGEQLYMNHFGQAMWGSPSTAGGYPDIVPNNSFVSPGIGYGPVTYYFAEGLDPHASITVDARCCIEYTLASNSPAVRLASMPRPDVPGAITAVKNMGRVLPSSAPLTPAQQSQGWLSWYGSTMKNIVGTVWGTAGSLLQHTNLPALAQFGTGIANAGNYLRGGPARLAIAA